MIVVRAGAGGNLEIDGDARFPLRLVRDSAGRGRLGSSAVARVAEALRAFQALSRGAGVDAVVAVATAAVRESTNSQEFVRRVAAETGIELEILSGDREARYAFAGAVHGLPVDSGLVLDIGGGSVQMCRFRHRRPTRVWTLPLGALLLSDRFLVSDPARPSEVARLRQHVLATVADAGIPALSEEEQLVGTGGTLRNLAKVDRAQRTYPISRMHGYRLTRDGVDRAIDSLAPRPLARRRRVPGLSDDRADSIVGGALCAQVVLGAVGTGEVLLSGRGLREGIALERLGLKMVSPPELRRSSVLALARRFATWDAGRAELRSGLAASLLDALAPGLGTTLGEVMGHAALLVDIGRSVDYYSRWEHAARAVADSDLYGFGHREILLVSTVLHRAGGDRVSLRGLRTLLSTQDQAHLETLAVLLRLADDLGHRLRVGDSLSVQLRRGEIVVALPEDVGPLDDALGRRFHGSFGRPLHLSVTGSQTATGNLGRRRRPLRF